MRLNKKTKRRIKAQAARYRKFYNQPCPEVDALLEELRQSASQAPKGMTLDEELKYILEQEGRQYE